MSPITVRPAVVLYLVLSLVLFGIAACATVGGKPAAPSAAQIAQTVCPVVQLDLGVLQTGLAGLTTDAKAVKLSADIANIRPKVDEKCQQASLVTTADLQSFAQFALPTMADAVAYLPLAPAQKTKLTNDLMLAQVALGVIGIVEQQLHAAPASAASSRAAS